MPTELGEIAGGRSRRLRAHRRVPPLPGIDPGFGSRSLRCKAHTRRYRSVLNFGVACIPRRTALLDTAPMDEAVHWEEREVLDGPDK